MNLNTEAKMSFKLGTAKTPYAVNGEIKSHLTFRKDLDASVPGTPIIRKELEPGINGEANADGSIFLSKDIEPGSEQERNTLQHEMVHATEMKISPNKLSYGDDYVVSDGNTYKRKTINGKDMIYDIEIGEWKEAGDDFPWERRANNI